MQIVGKVTRADMSEIQRRGMGPKAAVDAIRDEAKARHPRATILIQPSNMHDGFDIIAM